MANPKRWHVLVAGVRSGAGDHRAEDERDAGDGGDDHMSGRRSPSTAPSVSLVGSAGAEVEDDGVGDEDHRQQEMGLHRGRVEIDQNGHAAERDLPEDSRDESE